MPASSIRRRNVWWLIVASTLLTACQSLDLSQPESAPSSITTPPVSVAERQELPCKSQGKPRTETRIVTRTEVIYQPVSIDNKLTIGAVEAITFPGMNDLVLDARIDTGASTSSLHVTSSQIFERDGARWVSFTMPVEGRGDITIERPLTRNVLIKRKGAESQERPVVVMNIRIGRLQRASEFTLTDRTGFEFPVLIGRNFLTDVAIVDVSHEYLASDRP